MNTEIIDILKARHARKVKAHIRAVKAAETSMTENGKRSFNSTADLHYTAALELQGLAGEISDDLAVELGENLLHAQLALG